MQQQAHQSSSTSSPCSSSQPQNGMGHHSGVGQQQHNNHHHNGSESVSLASGGSSNSASHMTSLAQPYAAEASNFGPSLYHHHLNLHNHQLNGFSANAAGHYNLHPHLHAHHPYNKASSTSPVATVGGGGGSQIHGGGSATTIGSVGSSASRSPSEVESTGINADYLGTYHPHHQGFYTSLHHHNMNIASHHHHHPYQHMVRSNGTYIDFVPR